MARVKLTLPEKSIFQTEIEVRITDLNYGGHVGNDNILSLMHECRMRFLASLGYKSEIGLGENIGIIISDVIISYKSESFYGDHLTVNISVDDFNKYGFDMFYELINKKTGQQVAIGKTGIVCMNYEKRKVSTIPETFLQQLQK
ncbi:acyl-CoA thioesterase [Fulvivirga sediminis]|uniref:Thioesterase family protein n=1 Tax=Fulvivirga sediminis TaxID=2803949 RepID=A0A937K0H1_9BACT|nr:thioesterase family protein [Fulvivirga sediminis]MBL3656321.1 thioesterase family protein [Fulvivirga sediminis]